MAIWLTIFASWPAPLSPSRVTARAKAAITGLTRSKAAASPPHITVSTPFCAPAWPPETGRVDELQAALERRLGEFARHVGRGRGVVDEHRARLHAGEGAVVAEHDRAQVVVVADAAEDDVGAGRGLARRGRMRSGALGLGSRIPAARRRTWRRVRL